MTKENKRYSKQNFTTIPNVELDHDCLHMSIRNKVGSKLNNQFKIAFFEDVKVTLITCITDVDEDLIKM